MLLSDERRDEKSNLLSDSAIFSWQFYQGHAESVEPDRKRVRDINTHSMQKHNLHKCTVVEPCRHRKRVGMGDQKTFGLLCLAGKKHV